MSRLRLQIGLILPCAAIGQERPEARVGVGVLQNSNDSLSGTAARDTLVKLPNAQQLVAVR